MTLPRHRTGTATAFALMLSLAGCAQGPAAVMTDIPLRNPTAPVASQANLPIEEIAGEWPLVQSAGITQGKLRIEPGSLVISRSEGGFAKPATYDGNGRFSTHDLSVWVFWADTGRRTIALGDPNGSFVLIANRDAQAAQERIDAARDILEWYGFDLSQLKDPVPIPEGAME